MNQQSRTYFVHTTEPISMKDTSKCISGEHRQSKEWTGNAGKIANVADATSVMQPDALYFRTLYLHFNYISKLCIYTFQARAAMSMQLLTFKTPIGYNKAKFITEYLRYF